MEPSRGRRLVPLDRGHIPYGFNDSAYLVGQLDIRQSLKVHRAAGSRMWRLPLDWGKVEPSFGELDFSQYDEIYCAAIDAGVRPLWNITGVPTWAARAGACSATPCVRPPEPQHLAALRRFAELAAIRYPRSMAIEAWNEPNLTEFWGGPPDPAAYMPVLRAIYGGVNDGNPGVAVLGAALANNPVDEPGARISLATYLAALAEAGALEYMDGLSVHAYPGAALGSSGDLFTPALAAARGILADGAPGTRIWVTETGAPTANASLPQVTERQQADLMADVYRALDRPGDVDAVVFHTLVEPTPDVPGGSGFGFFTAPDPTGVTSKPVLCAVLTAAVARAPCVGEVAF